MKLSLVGINHQTAPITIREKVAISSERLADSLLLLRSFVSRGVILSTCNRTEIYTIGSKSGDGEGLSLAFLKAQLGTGIDLLPYCHRLSDQMAAGHLFRVASGLESMVVGEFEVLGQVRQALEAAEKIGMAGLALRYVFQSAVRTGRRVREETGISKNALSVSSVAVDLAGAAIGDLAKCRMLVIGAGEAGKLVAKVAKERGISEIVIASRTKERAQSLAAILHGVPVAMDNLTGELSRASIVVACAGAPHQLVGVSDIEAVMKKRPGLPLVIIDIALPRNVNPDVGELRNVFLYNIDDLTQIAELNRKQRENEISRAEEIVRAEVEKFASDWHDFEVRPLIGALMSKAEKIRNAQLSKTLKKLPPLSREEEDSLEAMTRSIVTRILEDPLEYIKTNGNGSQAELVKELFKLDMEKL